MSEFDFNFQDTGTAVATPPARRAPAPQPELDPRRDIAPMGQSFFKQLDADPFLNARQKMALQGEYFQGLDQIQEYRDKLEDRRKRGIMDDLNIQKAQDELSFYRRKQAEAETSTQRQQSVAEQLRAANAIEDPYDRDEALNQVARQNIDVIGTDRSVQDMFQISKGMIPKADPYYERGELGTAYGEIIGAVGREAANEIINRGDPMEIEALRTSIKLDREAQKAKDENDTAARVQNSRNQRSLILSLTKDDFKFMDEDERFAAKVSTADENPYLRPQDHARGKQLILAATRDPQKLKEFEELPSDAERKKYLDSLRWEAMSKAYQMQEELINDLQNPQGSRADSLVD